MRRVLVAIGGIDLSTAESVMRAGADGIAVISAVWGAENPEAAASGLSEIVRQATGVV